MHRSETLDIPASFIRNAFVELADSIVDPNAAYGILKLAFENHIPFTNFPNKSLTSFQEKYKEVFPRFKFYLKGRVGREPFFFLPHTCFMFTVPFYNVLKDGGNILVENVDPNYKSFLIDLLA